jgi:hypothetical protein
MADAPKYPQPSFYETTITAEGLTHADVERIVTRPRWSLAEAEARLHQKRPGDTRPRRVRGGGALADSG